MDLSDVRRDYARAGLHERDLAAEPVEQLQRWLADAVAADPDDYTSMILATADLQGRPSARVVLLKGCDARGLVFYTNYESAKARQMEENPQAALVFYWSRFDRQVRVEGTVERTSREESEAYFHSRPRGSQIGAWASRQSEAIAGREELEERVRELTERFAGAEVPLPDFWGGYRLVPETIEFWQGRPDRLHDRLRYRRLPDGGWRIERLSP
ncbi:MAG TPA: pyridoxamine 5'-phosphate oxidase [Thermoanaerobaculia bacterium]